MPDDERLGGTHDPHEYGRRHRREDVAPGEEKPRRRRRSMESGGLSVADLVQKHSASRSDMTPVDPQQLQQNALVSGRRARQDRQGAEGPAGRGHPGEAPRRQAPPPPSIADALGDDAPEFPRADAPRASRHAPRNGFPPDVAPRRPTSHPGEAARNGRRAAEAPQSGHHALPPDAGEAPRNGHHAAEGPGFPVDPAATRNGRRTGHASGHHALPPTAPGEAPGRRPGEGSAFFPADTGRNGHHAAEPPGFPQNTPPDTGRNGRRGGSDSFFPDAPGDASGPHRRGAEHPAFPADAPHPGGPRSGSRRGEPPDFPADAPGAFLPDAPGEGSAPRRRGAASPGFPADAPGHSSGPRRGGGAPGFPADTPNAFLPDAPGDASGPHRRGAEHPGFRADAPHPGAPGDGSGPRRRGADGSGFPGHPGEPRGARRGDEPPSFPADATGAFAPGEGSGPRRRGGETPVPLPGSRRPGEASAHHPVPGEGPSPRPRRDARRAGEASAHHAVPGDPAFPRDDAPRNGRRPGEVSAHHQVPVHPLPGEAPFPRDDAPRNGRRPGEASAQFGADPHRQGPPTPPPGQWPGEQLSEPRLTPAAIDAPDARPRTTGVPPVPPPVPPRGDDDLVSMTTEMEAIGEDVQKRRTIDHTLARFSAVHDEIRAEEREKKAKRRKLLPWQNDDTEMDSLDEMEAQQSMAMRVPVIPADDEQEPEPEEEPKQSRLRRKKGFKKLRGRSAGKAFVVFFAALVFVGSAAGWSFKAYVDAKSNTVDALDPDSKAILDAQAQLGDENFLLVGSDTRAGAAAEEGVGDENTVQGARSDTVMIAHIPKSRERVVVVSFPRDLEVNRPACDGWDPKTGELTDEQHPAEQQVKINTAYQVGGPKCVTKMVQELSGLAINHFVGIDFHGFKDMVDAVKGVEVCVERPMKDDVLGTVVAEAGKNVRLSGDQALNFVRARHVEGDVTSDYGRIIRQQRFLSSLLRKAMSAEVLLDPGKLTDFVDAFSKATFGDNVGVDQLLTLGQSMQGIDAGKVTFITVPTVGESNERGNEDLLVDDTDALFDAIRQDTPLPGEAPEKKPVDDASQNTAQLSGLKQDQPQGPIDPKTIKIQVLNGGNDTDGIAGDTADSLASYGFQIMRVDPAPEDIDKPAIIKHGKERLAEAQTLQAAVPGSQLVEDESVGGAVMLVVGPGFDGEVVSPAGGGKTAEVPDNLQTVNAGDVSCA
ncbi:LCP family protein [Actinophytocola glycyrrhizae]|uniref:LCP family protein n=1 Tax=Actinophytocola glycyrrhizae TaxID=2044873 RepID=A0ABV9SFW7_9PSEU